MPGKSVELEARGIEPEAPSFHPLPSVAEMSRDPVGFRRHSPHVTAFHTFPPFTFNFLLQL